MKPAVRKILIIFLSLVLVVSLVVISVRRVQYKQADEVYAEAAELAGLPDFSQIELPEKSPVNEEIKENKEDKEESEEDNSEENLQEDVTDEPDETDGEVSDDDASEPKEEIVYVDPYADALSSMDFTALREANSEVLGWILIPGTNISYPLMDGEDNEYYLNHSWRKGYSISGAIFLERMNSSSLSDFNTIIYGHRMNNGTMFAPLKNYKDRSYFEAHPVIYISDDAGCHTYEIFAAYEVSVEGQTYAVGHNSDSSKQEFIDYCLGQSMYDTGIVPTVNDRIVTLSTCTGRGHATRWVVQGVMRMPTAEEPSVTEPAEDMTVPDISEDVLDQDALNQDAVPEGNEAEAPSADAEQMPNNDGDASDSEIDENFEERPIDSGI